jgi:hypothetical protein
MGSPVNPFLSGENAMKLGIGILAAVVLFGTPLVAAGAEHRVSFTRTRAHTITATVQAVDQDTRMVTLKGKKGGLFTFRAGDRVKNLAQVKVGDRVYVDYFESLEVYVSNPDGGGAASGSSTSVETARMGEKPAGSADEEVTMVATVASIAKNKKSVTLKSQNGTKTVFPVKNRENLVGVHVGDQVTIITTQAVAVSVEEAPLKKKP